MSGLRIGLVAVFALLLFLAPASAELARPSSRFVPGGAPFEGEAQWATRGTDSVVFGRGASVTIASRGRLSLDAPAVDGALAGASLYLVQRIDDRETLTIVDLEALASGAAPARLGLESRGSLRLARMDDYLVVAEGGAGIRILELPGHHHEGMAHHGRVGTAREIGFVTLDEPIFAVTAALRTIYVAAAGGLVVIDASVPHAPSLSRRVELYEPAGVRALAANGTTLYLLGDGGLRWIDLASATGAEPAGFDPEIRGSTLLLAGRRLYVASGEAGLRTFDDRSPAATTFFVQVGDVFFSPPGTINVNAGDTVQWQKPATIFTHNVFSCRTTQLGCTQNSTEPFTSGVATTAAFNFSKTFSVVGANPYLCQSHATTMTGNIQVAAGGPPAPPQIPDGQGASTPVTITKLDASGTDLSVSFDDGCAGAARHDLLYGTESQLPASPGGLYATSGAVCNIGLSPFNWTTTPVPAAGSFLWWVVVADDGAGTEGSWGGDGAAAERNGAGTNGASALCGNTDKDTSAACGP